MSAAVNAKPAPVWREGLEYPKDTDILQPRGLTLHHIHDGRLDMMPFLNDCAITEHNGRIYVAWYNSTNTEIGGSSLIRGRWSGDEGETWSDVFTIVGTADFNEIHYVPPNLFTHEGKLYAIISKSGVQQSLDDPQAGLGLYVMNGDESWSHVSRVFPGFTVTAAPVLMDNGNYIMGGWRGKRGMTNSFAGVLISNGKDIASPWRCSFLFDPLLPGALNLRCAEVGFAVDGARITAYVRDDIGRPGDPSGGGRAWAFVSEDYGESWSKPIIMDKQRVGNSKLYAGKLSTGKKYVIYNDDRGFFNRTLLLIAVTEPGGEDLTRVYKLFDGPAPELGGRGLNWFYPCSYEYNGHLYVAVTLEEKRRGRNVRGVAVAKVPVASM